MSIFISKKNIVLFILLLFAVFLFWLSTVNAQGYVPLAPLPGVPAGQETDIGSYLGSIFKIGIGLAGVFAVLMIIISGIQFIGGAASPSAHTEAKERMVNAILGLILALGSWLILNTINPNLLKTNLELAEVTVTGSGPSGFVTQNQIYHPAKLLNKTCNLQEKLLPKTAQQQKLIYKLLLVVVVMMEEVVLKVFLVFFQG